MLLLVAVTSVQSGVWHKICSGIEVKEMHEIIHGHTEKIIVKILWYSAESEWLDVEKSILLKMS